MPDTRVGIKSALWFLAIQLLLVASLAGCMSDEPAADEPAASSSSPAPTQEVPGTNDTTNATDSTPEPSEPPERPWFLTGCQIWFTSTFGPVEPVQAALPDGWTASVAAGDLATYRAFWWHCEGSSRDNESFEGPVDFAFAAINVDAPDEYAQGGGPDLFLFWALTNGTNLPLGDWDVPVAPAEFSNDGLLDQEKEAQADQASLSVQAQDIQDGSATPGTEETYYHYQTPEGIQTLRGDVARTLDATFTGTGAFDGEPWSEAHGPLTGSQYQGTAMFRSITATGSGGSDEGAAL